MDIIEACKLLGAAEREISSVTDTPAGTVIDMADGSSYIEVPEETPDAAGQTGLMYFKAPTERYAGTFPVFVQPDADDSAGITEADAPAAADQTTAPESADEEAGAAAGDATAEQGDPANEPAVPLKAPAAADQTTAPESGA